MAILNVEKLLFRAEVLAAALFLLTILYVDPQEVSSPAILGVFILVFFVISLLQRVLSGVIKREFSVSKIYWRSIFTVTVIAYISLQGISYIEIFIIVVILLLIKLATVKQSNSSY